MNAAATPGVNYSSLLLMVGLFAIMWLMIVRPQKKKEKETESMRNALSVGDEIVTIGGFYGKIVKVKNDRLVIQCGADRTRLEIARWAVSSVVAKAGADTSAAQIAAEAEEPAGKPSPKSIKRLGKGDSDAAEESETKKSE